MSLAYLFDSNIQFQDKSGNNNVNGFLRVYIDNTDDRAVTYKDFNGTLNQADIRLDNNGRAVVIVDDSKTYRLEVYGTTGVLLWTLYPISPKATGINETLEALVAAVKSHTIAIEGLALGKKNKQQAKVISGSPTQTVKSISQNADGEITVEFEDIDFPYNTEISSPDGSIEVGTPVVDPVLKKETIPLSVANKGKVLIDENDSQQKYLEDAVKADENGLLRVRVDENEDSTPEHPDKVLVIDDSELRDEIYGNTQRIENIEEAIDELDMDSVPHAYLGSTLFQSAGDSVTTGTPINVFSCTAPLVGDCFEFEQTTTIDDTPYGYLWIEPGTYLINASVTLQWVGNPRGTFVAKVGKVMGENVDFSQEQELLRSTTRIVTIPNRMKLSINITYDAGTPAMGFWIQSLQVVKLAGGMSQTNVTHDDTLIGQGSVANPLGVDKAKVAQSTLAGNIAPAFDPTRTSENAYLAGQSVMHNGTLATFAVDHYGAWSDADVMYNGESAFEALVRLTALSVIETVIKDSDFVQGLVSQTGVIYPSYKHRKRSRFVYASRGYIVVVCPGYDIRLTFFNTNSLGTSYIVDEDNPVNQKWQNGDSGIKVKVPTGAITFVISVRRRDNADFEVDENPVVSYGLINQDTLLRKGLSSSGSFVDSSKTVMTYPVKKIIPESHTMYLVKVHIPSGYKARIIYSTHNTTFGPPTYFLPWHTENFCDIIYDIATFYTVQFMKIDETDIVDNSYRDCRVEPTTNPVANCIVSVLGDSISTFGGSTSDPDAARFAVVGDPTYPGNRCRYPQTNLGFTDSDVDFTYWMRLIHAFGARLGISESWAGSRISNTQATDYGDLGPNRCIASQTRIGHLGVNGTPDLILVYGGTNDAGGNVTIGTFNTESPANYSQSQIDALPVDTFANACRAMMIRLQKTYPNAKIIVILPNYVKSAYSPEKLDPYCEMLKTVCDYFGVQYVDIRTSGISMFNASSFLADGVHPNKSGMLLIANCIASTGTITRDII